MQVMRNLVVAINNNNDGNHNDNNMITTIIIIIGSRPSDHYFRSVCLSVCLFVCLSVCLCSVFLSRLRSDLDQTRIHVKCPGLVVSPRI